MANDLQLPKMTSNEFETIAKQKLLQVFNMPCNFVSPFTPKMAARLLIYCEIHPSIELLNAIVDISSKYGETGFFFSFVELIGDEIAYPGVTENGDYLKTWFIPYENIPDYLNQYFIPSHFIYSSHGTWGIYMDEDDFLLIGGIPEQIDELKQILPNIDGHLDEFFEDWKNKKNRLNAKLEWIPKMLEHVYGSKKARQLLDENGLFSLQL